MRLYLVFYFALISIFNCIGQKEFNYGVVADFLSSKEICIGEKDCLELKNKNIFIIPYLDSLSELFNFRSPYAYGEFTKLHDDYISISLQIDSLSGKKLDEDFYKKVKFKTTNDINQSDISLSITPFFKSNGEKYCIVRIKETKYVQWFIKLKEKGGEIIAYEIVQVLD